MPVSKLEFDFYIYGFIQQKIDRNIPYDDWQKYFYFFSDLNLTPFFMTLQFIVGDSAVSTYIDKASVSQLILARLQNYVDEHGALR